MWARRLAIAALASTLASLTQPAAAQPTVVRGAELIATLQRTPDAALTYDRDRQRVVLFGGLFGPGASAMLTSTLWESVDGSFVSRGDLAIEPRAGAAVAYDERRKLTVIIGGFNRQGAVGGAYTWDGTSVAPEQGEVLPGPLKQPFAVYDAAHDELVIFDGNSGETWVRRSDGYHYRGAGLEARFTVYSTLVYDRARGEVLSFGGIENDGSFDRTLLRWDGASWREVTSEGKRPPARANAAFVFDERSGEVLLTGGNDGGGLLNDAWSWDGTRWKRLPDAPVSLTQQATYDAARGLLVAVPPRSALSFSVVTFDGETWATEPVTRHGPRGREGALWAHDDTADAMLLVGGVTATNDGLDEPWWFDGQTWKKAPFAPPPTGVLMASASVPGLGIVVHGGLRRDGKVNDETGVIDVHGYRTVAAGAGPGAREAPSMCAWRGGALLFGGLRDGDVLGDTWRFADGTWTRIETDGAPSNRAFAAMATEPSTGDVVLFGGIDAKTTHHDTWRFDGARWREVESTEHPQASLPLQLLGDERSGRVVALSANEPWELEPSGWRPLRFAWPRGFTRSTVVAAGLGGRLLGFSGIAEGEVTGTLYELEVAGHRCAEGSCGALSCVDDVCCLSTSCGVCASCRVAGHEGECAQVPAHGSDDSCDEGLVCDASATCRLPPGARCEGDDGCSTGMCVDGVCCLERSCEGPCVACWAGEAPGRCGVVHGREVQGRCDGGRRCDSAGACKPAAGATCGGPGECASGRCAAGVCVDDQGPLCIGEHRSQLADGTEIECGDARCVAGKCVETCTSTADCVPPSRCGGDGRCVRAEVLAEARGCGASRGRAPAHHGLWLAIALAALGARRRRAAALAAALTIGLCAPAAAETNALVQVTTPWAAARAEASPTVDASTGDVLLFGGIEEWTGRLSSDVLRYRRGASALSTTRGPQPRAIAAVGFDAERQRLVVMGGAGAGYVLLEDLWELGPEGWTQRRDVALPSVPGVDSLHWDARKRRLLLVEAANAGQVWSYDGERFTALEDDEDKKLPSVARPGVALDEARGVIVLFGGVANEHVSASTWERDERGWRLRHEGGGEAPPPQTGMTAAYDPVRGAVVMCSRSAQLVAKRGCYAWDGASWSKIATLPPQNHASVIAWSESHQALLAFSPTGGLGEGGSTLVLGPSGWEALDQATQPAPRLSASATFDATSKRGVLHGGALPSNTGWNTFDATWVCEQGAWRRLDIAGPGRRWGASMAAVDGGVLLFGGMSEIDQGFTDEAWLLEGDVWRRLELDQAPSPRITSMAGDGQRAVLFGGATNSVRMNDTWVFEAGRFARIAVDGPWPARFGHVMGYDPRRQRTLLHGGTGSGGSLLRDTWAFDGARWEKLSPAETPPALDEMSGYFDPEADRFVVMGVPTVAGVPSAWVFDGVTWAPLADETGVTQRRQASTYHDPQRHLGVVVGGFTTSVPAASLGAGAITLVGMPCASGGECPTGACVDGVCCERAACGTCSVCDAPGRAGTCTPLAAGATPRGGCDKGQLCGGDGSCVDAIGVRCEGDAGCLSGHCVDGVCCEPAACPGVCQTCASKGHPGHCERVLDGVDDTCNGMHICDAEGACKIAEGQPCERFDECASQLCAAGVCQRGDAPVCEDRHLLRLRGGDAHDCAPFACGEQGACLTRCDSTADCAPGLRCDEAGACVDAPRSRGAGCAVGGEASAGLAAGLVALAAALARRRR